ncbi:MAG: FAD/NAD(P)-binding oxidoreductase [Nitriliruptorales bacterium]|nr:FAD/NAD(P)-binding oxidoreductase [Nitriliruptorales bacterium]
MDICVLGGGFGGLAAATELRRLLPDAAIRVVDAGDEFFMGFAKLWELGDVRSLAEGTRPLANLAAHGIEHVRAEITAIDAAGRRAQTSLGELTADALIIALGGGVNATHRALLVGEHAHDLYDPAALPAMKAAIDETSAGRIVVSILGGPFRCPPAPYEAAMIVHERLAAAGHRDDVEIVLTTPQPMTLPAAGVDASEFLAGHLATYGVDLRHGHMVTGCEGRTIRFANGEALDADVWLAVPASAPLEVLSTDQLAGPSGWIEPDRLTLQATHDRVYAIGDCTHIPNQLGAIPKAGVFAAGEGLVAAANVAADLGVGDGATFDGHGFCFLELPDKQVAFVQGDFYADPVDVELTPPSRASFDDKLAFEAERLDLWLPHPS